MIAHVVISLGVPLTTTVAAILWARFVSDGMVTVPEIDGTERIRDIRTW